MHFNNHRYQCKRTDRVIKTVQRQPRHQSFRKRLRSVRHTDGHIRRSWSCQSSGASALVERADENSLKLARVPALTCRSTHWTRVSTTTFGDSTWSGQKQGWCVTKASSPRQSRLWTICPWRINEIELGSRGATDELVEKRHQVSYSSNSRPQET